MHKNEKRETNIIKFQKIDNWWIDNLNRMFTSKSD